MNFTAVIITKNEEKNIERCLRSLSSASEIVVVDSGSTDSTLEIISRFPKVKLVQAPWIGYSENKRMGIREASFDFILWMDADEALSPELEEEIGRLDPTAHHAYDVPRKTFFLGDWIRHCGWYPGRVIRLFNKNFCDLNDNILHEGVVVKSGGSVGHLRSDLLHYSYTSLYQYFDKMNRYGKYGAEELARKGKKASFWQILLKPPVTFFRFYILRAGFLDGVNGFIISSGSAYSNFIRYVNFYFLKHRNKL